MANFVTSIHANAGKAPDWVMYLPEGTHEIHASVNGKPGKRTVTVSEACVTALQASLQARIESGRKPCIYFDHKRGAAAAYPDRFEYGQTEDGKRGVMMHIAQWSGKGRSAVEGADYNGFSPTFLVNEQNAPCGLPSTTAEIGSLTNEPAFTANARIAASCPENDQLAAMWQQEAKHDAHYAAIAAAWEPLSDSTDPENKNTMNKYLIEKLKLKEDASEDEIKAAFEAAIAKPAEPTPAEPTDDKGKTPEPPPAPTEDPAKDKKIAELEKQLEAEKAKNADTTKKMAAAAVQAAVEAGKIAPKDEKTKAAIMAAFEADPANGQVIIAAMHVAPALSKTPAVNQPSNAPTKRSVADDYADELK